MGVNGIFYLPPVESSRHSSVACGPDDRRSGLDARGIRRRGGRGLGEILLVNGVGVVPAAYSTGLFSFCATRPSVPSNDMVRG